MSVRGAAGLPETFITVWSNLFLEGGLKAGETLLVHGGAGGIGTTAIQLAKAFGIRVFATDSPAERCTVCAELGADRVIDYAREDFVSVMRGAGGADMILDIVGGAYAAPILNGISKQIHLARASCSLHSRLAPRSRST